MRHPLMSSTLLLGFGFLACNAFALQTEDVPASKLKAYGVTLDAAAGMTQWQQLWKHSRDAGHFLPQGSQERFTVPQRRVPDMISTTLTQADSVTAIKPTQALYRHDFGEEVGVRNQEKLTAVCLWVDWRVLPDGSDPADPSYMGGVSLVLTRPCR